MMQLFEGKRPVRVKTFEISRYQLFRKETRIYQYFQKALFKIKMIRDRSAQEKYPTYLFFCIH